MHYDVTAYVNAYITEKYCVKVTSVYDLTTKNITSHLYTKYVYINSVKRYIEKSHDFSVIEGQTKRQIN